MGAKRVLSLLLGLGLLAFLNQEQSPAELAASSAASWQAVMKATEAAVKEAGGKLHQQSPPQLDLRGFDREIACGYSLGAALLPRAVHRLERALPAAARLPHRRGLHLRHLPRRTAVSTQGSPAHHNRISKGLFSKRDCLLVGLQGLRLSDCWRRYVHKQSSPQLDFQGCF